MNDYPGTYDEYLASCGDDHLDADAAILRVRREKRARKRGEPRREKPQNEATIAKKKKQLELRRDVVTAAIEKAERRVEEIDRAFCKPGFFEETDDHMSPMDTSVPGLVIAGACTRPMDVIDAATWGVVRPTVPRRPPGKPARPRQSPGVGDRR